ncbi:SdiA-regulated domain-containing protein [Escherichia marmotae]|nr:SdiA-regulated domain-containing protein [Escherichia marmotae]
MRTACSYFGIFSVLSGLLFAIFWPDSNYPQVISHIVAVRTIDDIKDNLSGLTYDEETGSLYAIINRPPEIIQMDVRGNLIKRMSLTELGLEDTEGISAAGDEGFWVVEERKRRVVFVKITSDGMIRESSCPVYDNGGKRNVGTEGIAWSEENRVIFTANEKKTAAVFVAELMSNGCFSEPILIYSSSGDIAGLDWDIQRQRLFILSEEDKTVTEIDVKGRIYRHSRLSDFLDDIPQPEGIAVNGDNLYIVSEPNHFYHFKLSSEPAL